MPVAKSGADFAPVPAGNYFAVVVGCFDIGTQPGGQYGPKHKVILQFELHKKKGVVRDQQGDPVVTSAFYTLAFSDKSPLRHHSEAILGRKFTKEEAKEGYDVADLLDRACRVTIIHEEKGDRIRDSISAIMTLDEDDPEIRPESDSVLYDLNPSKPIPSNVPEWVQKFILASVEFKDAEKPAARASRTEVKKPSKNGHSRATKPAATAVAEDDDDASDDNQGEDDIPF